jgi:hypothetical protein
LLNPHAHYALAIENQSRCARIVKNFNSGFFGCHVEILHESRAAARNFDRHAAEEFAPAVDHSRLAAEVRHETRAFRAQPRHGIETLRHEYLGQIRVGPIAREPKKIVEEFFFRIRAEIAVGDLVVAELGHALQVVDRIVGEAHHAAGEAAVAAGFFFRCGFEHQNFGAILVCRQRGAQRGIAFADHDYVELSSHLFL